MKRYGLSSCHSYQAVTNNKGIYALTKLPSAGSFAIQPDRPGFTFSKQTVETGISRDQQASAGNKWGIDFVGTRVPSPLAKENPFDPQPRSESTGPGISTPTD